MKLRNVDAAEIPEAKLVGYLLSLSHSGGRSKARFFTRFGFAADRWITLADALRSHAAEHDVTQTEDSPYGTRYVIDGPLRAPDGRSPNVRAVWFVERGETTP